MLQMECNILLSKNRTLFNIDNGWEGIPFNILSNSFICIFLLILLVLIRWRNQKTIKDPKKNSDWLHFIFDDRITNDLKAAKFKIINRRHPLAYLPPILHDYQQLISDKIEDKTEDNISFYRHNSEDDLDIGQNESFEEMPTLRSDLDFKELTESKINELYSEFNIQRYNSKEEDQEVKRLKILLVDNYVQQNEIKKERIKEPMKTTTILDYIYHYLYITDELIIKNKGSDALQYLLFQRYLIYFLTFLTLICLIIILPINLKGTNEPDIKKYSKTTVSNLGKGSNLIWIHSFMTLMTVAMGMFMMSHFSKLNRANFEGIDRRVLLIQNIPESKRNTKSLVNYFNEKFPKVVIKTITFVYDTRLLQYMKNRLLTAIEAKKYCYQYRLIYEQRCEVRPYRCGRFGGCLCCCGCCPKLDGVLHYAEEKAELEKEIIVETNRLLSKPIGSAFVMFEKKWMVKEIFNSFNSQNFLMVWFNSIKYLFVSDSDSMNSHLWRVYYAPLPEDIEWSDIAINRNCQRLLSVLMHSILVFIFLFLTTPSIAVEIVLFLTQRTSDLKTLSQFLKPYLLMLMTAILPSLVLIVQYQIPYTTRSALNHSLMYKAYGFLVLMVLILPPLNYWTAAVFLDTIFTSNGTESRINWNCLFPSGNSGFYTNYILSSAFVGNIFELLRVSELLSYIVYLFFISRSVAEYESARQKITFSFHFGTKYAKILLIFTIIVTYSISSPLIAPAGLFYFVVKHFVDRYNLYYVYNPTQISSGMHSTAVICVHITLLLLLFQVSTTLSQYEDYDTVMKPSTLTYFALLIFFLVICFRICRHFYYNN